MALTSSELQAVAMLQLARNDLLQRARRISDPASRRSFLENIAWNRQINDLWQTAQANSDS